MSGSFTSSYPSPEQLVGIVRGATLFLDYLCESGLVVGSRLPSLPSEETRLRSQIAGPWCAWERSLAAVGRPPTEPGGPVRMWREGEPGPLPECIAATGWSESRNLVDA